MTRESMEYDVVIIGAGLAGLASAIRLAQLAIEHQSPLKIAVLEKGSEVGAHLLSGAVFDPRALNELIPNWQEKGAPLETPVTQDSFLFLTKCLSFKLPTPPQMQNSANYIVSIDRLSRWLAQEAERLGVEIFAGFPAAEILFDANNQVIGVLTQEVGINQLGEPKPNYQPGIELRAHFTLLAEGCRGSLTKQLCERYDLQKDKQPQTYGIGIKELWEIEPKQHSSGKIIHSIGWPLDQRTYGGAFIYHMDPNLLSVGFVVGLDYENPFLDPFEELQRFKHHPTIRPLFEGGRRIEYGARALNEGGIQSIPKLSFPGGLLIGCAAGFLNVPKIKGNHTAMKSGMVAAETVFKAFKTKKTGELTEYETAIRQSWIWPELHQARNIRPAFKWGLLPGLIHAAFDTYILRGRAPWTFRHHHDHKRLKKAKDSPRIDYPKPDGKISFDKLTSVQLSNTFHAEDQPNHLKLKDPTLALSLNLAEYDSPEQRYCPAKVYEIVRPTEQTPYLQINAQNCIHCKTCDIKDPTQNINWITPEGGNGPNYSNM